MDKAVLWFSLPLLVATLGLLGAHWWQKVIEVRLARSGIPLDATVVSVWIEKGRCIVSYSFNDPSTGAILTRSGHYSYVYESAPEPGDRVVVRILPGTARHHRLEAEIDLAA